MDEQDLDLTGELVRAFVITNGRGLPSDNAFSMTTLVTAAPGALGQRSGTPEARQVLELLSGGYLSVAEVSGHTQLPLGVVRILLAQMEDAGLVLARPPVPQAERPSREVLNAVLTGLVARFGA